MTSDVDEYAQLAHSLVDSAINRALNQLAQAGWCDEPLHEYVSDPNEKRRTPQQQVIPYGEDHGHVPNITWPMISEFSPELGIEKIQEFIQTWQHDDSWLYCIDLIGTDDLDYDVRYRYRVRWSIPTRRQPIPRATASIYFTIDVSKIKPKDTIVKVYYVFEGNRLVHRPGHSRFEEKWLKDIIESKILVISQITF
jgi:A-kinase anchor protein 14